MKLKLCDYGVVDLSGVSRTSGILMKYSNVPSGESVTLSSGAKEALGYPEHIELLQSKDMDSFIVRPLKKSSENSLKVQSKRKTQNFKNKKILQLFRIYNKHSEKNIFHGEVVEGVLFFKLSE